MQWHHTACPEPRAERAPGPGRTVGATEATDTDRDLHLTYLDAARRLPERLLEQAVHPGELLVLLQELTEKGDQGYEP